MSVSFESVSGSKLVELTAANWDPWRDFHFWGSLCCRENLAWKSDSRRGTCSRDCSGPPCLTGPEPDPMGCNANKRTHSKARAQCTHTHIPELPQPAPVCAVLLEMVRLGHSMVIWSHPLLWESSGHPLGSCTFLGFTL